MTPSKTWEQWDGIGFPSDNYDAIIYHFPGKLDIEDPDNLDNLITEILQDGIAESKSDARKMLDSATVTHGQTVLVDGDLHWYSGPRKGEDGAIYEDSTDGTWVTLGDSDE